MTPKNSRSSLSLVEEFPVSKQLPITDRVATQRERYNCILKLKGLLGGPSGFLPFAFRFADGSEFYAHGSGLEGFLYSFRELEEFKGRKALCAQLPYFFHYLRDLFRTVGWDCS